MKEENLRPQGGNNARHNVRQSQSNSSRGHVSSAATGNQSAADRQRALARRKRREQRRRRLIWRRRIVIAALVVILLFLIFVASRIKLLLQAHAYITITPNDIEMVQGDEIPSLTATIDMKDKRGAVLDKADDYTAEDLKAELENGDNFTIVCDTDGKTDGTFNLSVKLSKDLQEKLDGSWKYRLKITTETGKLKVKNKTGKWDENKEHFLTWSGDVVKNKLVSYRGRKYLFDKNGDKMTGLQTYNNKTYYFSKKTGASAVSKWLTVDGNKYYFGKNSAAKTGFVETKKGTYLFDSTGIMQTGDVSYGLMKCVIGDDGIVTEKEDVYIDPDKPMVALTFDDGPGERTLELLECLEQYHAHATFFMVGQNVAEYEDAVKKMAEIGCELGNHTWDHVQLTTLDSSGITKTINKTTEAIEAAADGGKVTVVRPPYGSVNDTVRETVEYPLIYWNIDTEDWKTRNADSTIEKVMAKADDGGRDGDIILMHDIHTETIDAALELIPKLTDAGYQLVTVSEMAEAKGQTMENGTVYYEFSDEGYSED